MATPTVTSPSGQGLQPLGRVTLVTGPEEFLNERVVGAVRAAVRRADPEAEISATEGAQLTPGTLGELSAPSLFSTTRCVVVQSVQDVDDSLFDGLVGYAEAPEPDIALVLVHEGGQKGAGLLNRLRKLPGVEEHKSEKPKGNAHLDFVGVEVRSHGGRMDRDAAEHLVRAVGTDLRSLAAAVQQLCDDFPDEQLTTELVRRYHSGRADVKGFDIADLAMAGRPAEALAELRWALDTGVEPPAVTGAFAYKVRQLARLKGAPRGQRDADLARDVGAAPFMIRRLRDQLRGWDEDGLARVVGAVARADAAVKGNAADPAYELERLVLTIVRSRGGD